MRDEDGWTTKAPISGARGCLSFAASLVGHRLGLGSLNAPAWKNKAEAKLELDRLVDQYSGYRYDDWAERMGQRRDLELTSASGIRYVASIEPSWYESPGDAISVLFTIHDGGIGVYYPLTRSILLEPGANSTEARL